MPLLDHFHAPLAPGRHWEGFHSFWASAITQQLNGEALPEAFFAEPHTKLGSAVEIDVGTFRRERGGKAHGGVATEIYAPPEPALTFAVDLSDPDSFEIQVRREEEGIAFADDRNCGEVRRVSESVALPGNVLCSFQTVQMAARRIATKQRMHVFMVESVGSSLPQLRTQSRIQNQIRSD